MKKLIPILYQPEMSRAIVENRKWVTRRMLKHPTIIFATNYAFDISFDLWAPIDQYGHVNYYNMVKPAYGLPGDILCVRENYFKAPYITDKMLRDGADTWAKYYYQADENETTTRQLKEWGWKLKPSIHMPFEACRTFLKVTAVRIERLQDITEEQARGEGIEWITNKYGSGWKVYGVPEQITQMPIVSYRSLWGSINGPDSWRTNPFVWVIEFEKTEKPNTL